MKELKKKREELLTKGIDTEVEKAFELVYTYDEMKICVNSCTFDEVKTILCDDISVGGKQMHEIHEVINHYNAFCYIKKALKDNVQPGEKMLRELHRILKMNIIDGGQYRQVDYQDIKGRPVPPPAKDVTASMTPVYDRLDSFKADMEFVEICRLHAEITRIHPFQSLNGAAARLMANYLLMRVGWLPVSFSPEIFEKYFSLLNNYYETGDIKPFSDFVAEVEVMRLDSHLNC